MHEVYHEADPELSIVELSIKYRLNIDRRKTSHLISTLEWLLNINALLSLNHKSKLDSISTHLALDHHGVLRYALMRTTVEP